MNVENIESQRCLEEYRGVELAITKGVCHRTGEAGQTIANKLAVFVGGIVGQHHIVVFIVDHPTPLLVYACILQHVETSNATAFFYTLQGVEGVGVFGANLVVIVLAYKLTVAKIYKFVVHCGANNI